MIIWIWKLLKVIGVMRVCAEILNHRMYSVGDTDLYSIDTTHRSRRSSTYILSVQLIRGGAWPTFYWYISSKEEFDLYSIETTHRRRRSLTYILSVQLIVGGVWPILYRYNSSKEAFDLYSIGKGWVQLIEGGVWPIFYRYNSSKEEFRFGSPRD